MNAGFDPWKRLHLNTQKHSSESTATKRINSIFLRITAAETSASGTTRLSLPHASSHSTNSNFPIHSSATRFNRCGVQKTPRKPLREFLQCDADIFGTESLFADAEIIVLTGKALQALGINAYKILINDRQLFNKIIEKGIIKDENQLPTILRSLDKIQKIGERGVMNELQEKGFSPDVSVAILQNAKAMRENDRLLKIIEACNNMGKKNYYLAPILHGGWITTQVPSLKLRLKGMSRALSAAAADTTTSSASLRGQTFPLWDLPSDLTGLWRH